MIVCHVTCAHRYNDGRIFQKECRSLSRAGYEVVLVAPGINRVEDGVRVIGIGDTPSSTLKRVTLSAYKAYKAALDVRADIYHLHDPELLPYAKRLKCQGFKVIFDNHENVLETFSDKQVIPSFLRNMAGKSFVNYAGNIFSKLDALVTVTPAIVEQLSPWNSKTVLVTNYPELIKFEDKITNKEERTICFTGNINDIWSIKHVVDSMADTNNIRFVLCGFTTDDYLNRLKQSPGWKKCEYLGLLSSQEAKKVQQSSTVGLALVSYNKYFFYKEGSLGNTKIYEYMMKGLPVICTDVNVWKEMVEKYHCGVCVNPTDKKTLVNAIDFLMDNPDMAAEMGRNGRKAVENEYNWKTQEKVLLDLYSSLK